MMDHVMGTAVWIVGRFSRGEEIKCGKCYILCSIRNVYVFQRDVYGAWDGGSKVSI